VLARYSRRLELSGQRLSDRLPARAVAQLAAKSWHSTVRSMPPLSSRAGIGSERRAGDLACSREEAQRGQWFAGRVRQPAIRDSEAVGVRHGHGSLIVEARTRARAEVGAIDEVGALGDSERRSAHRASPPARSQVLEMPVVGRPSRRPKLHFRFARLTHPSRWPAGTLRPPPPDLPRTGPQSWSESVP
jgi:hypothetical protein